MGYQIVTWPRWRHVTLKKCCEEVRSANLATALLLVLFTDAGAHFIYNIHTGYSIVRVQTDEHTHILVTTRVWDWRFLTKLEIAWRISGIAVVSSIAIPVTVSLSSLRFQVSHNTTNKRGMGKTSHFLALNVNISKTVGDTSKLLITNRKSHMRFRLTPRSMTLDNLELL